MAGMKKVTFKWPLIGATLGILVCLPLLLELGAIMNGDKVGHRWELVAAVLCPTALLSLGFWWTLGLNCVLYALAATVIRVAWITFRKAG
jgi:uncharacterized membrane protein